MGAVQARGEDGAGESWTEFKIKALKEAKRYLKTDYKLHISRDEECTDHHTVHGLIDPSDGSADLLRECNHNHETNCERCDALENVITEVLQELENLVWMKKRK